MPTDASNLLESEIERRDAYGVDALLVPLFPEVQAHRRYAQAHLRLVDQPAEVGQLATA